MRARELVVLLILGSLAAAGVSEAQNQRRSRRAPAEPEKKVFVEPKLVLDREVFEYPGAGRRDPFRPLVNDTASGPRFENLTLRGIIHSPNAASSVALIAEEGGRIHRVRRGDRVGNARVLDIQTTRVLFSVDEFGEVRREILDLKVQHLGDKR
jgi:Tfp pilus assembly protein PilP